MSLFLEPEEQSPSTFPEQEIDTRNNYSWQQAFAEIGIDPLDLSELKLTGQAGRYFDEEEDMGLSLNLWLALS